MPIKLFFLVRFVKLSFAFMPFVFFPCFIFHRFKNDWKQTFFVTINIYNWKTLKTIYWSISYRHLSEQMKLFRPISEWNWNDLNMKATSFFIFSPIFSAHEIIIKIDKNYFNVNFLLIQSTVVNVIDS